MNSIIKYIIDYTHKGYNITFLCPGISEPLGLRIEMTYYDALVGKIGASYTIDNVLINDSNISLENILSMALENLKHAIDERIKKGAKKC